MIIVRTKHDDATRCLYYRTKPIIEMAQKKKFKVVTVEDKNVTNQNIRNRIIKQSPSFFFFNGHGSASAMYGNNSEEIINLNDADIFKNMVVFARACDCLLELGKKAVDVGCKTFIGYKKKFWITSLNEMASRPLNDPVSKPIMENSNLVVAELIRGKTAKEAIDKAHEHAAKLILNLVFSDDPYKSPALAALVSNDSALDFEGNPLGKIE